MISHVIFLLFSFIVPFLPHCTTASRGMISQNLLTITKVPKKKQNLKNLLLFCALKDRNVFFLSVFFPLTDYLKKNVLNDGRRNFLWLSPHLSLSNIFLLATVSHFRARCTTGPEMSRHCWNTTKLHATFPVTGLSRPSIFHPCERTEHICDIRILK